MTGRIAIAGLATVAVLGLTACGGNDAKPAAKSTRTTTSTSAAANLPPVPTVAELNDKLTQALDPSIPNAQKLDLVQGAQADPELPNRLAQAAKDAGAKATVTDVTSFGDSVNAKAKFVINGQENIVDVPFIAEDGKWKVQKSWTCAMLTNLGQTSVACS